jgi:hypothetical protein
VFASLYEKLAATDSVSSIHWHSFTFADHYTDYNWNSFWQHCIICLKNQNTTKPISLWYVYVLICFLPLV